ncbi:MAG TPA: Bax inhibitor-1 family protein [Oculatellaceae cyanobacterium]
MGKIVAVSDALEKSSLLGKTSFLFAIYMAVASYASYVGQDLHGGWAFWGILIGAIGCIIAMRIFVSFSALLGATFAVGLAFLIGLGVGPLIADTVHHKGWEPIAFAFGGTSVAALGFGSYGYLTTRNFASWGTGLFFALLALIGAGVVIGLTGASSSWYGWLGMLVFSGYFIYDANKLRQSENTWESAILNSINLFLDFVNFFEDWLLASRD